MFGLMTVKKHKAKLDELYDILEDARQDIANLVRFKKWHGREQLELRLHEKGKYIREQQRELHELKLELASYKIAAKELQELNTMLTYALEAKETK